MIDQYYNPYLDTQLDPDIADIVNILMINGIETFESCQGGDGHAFAKPTVRFHGGQVEGYKALAIAIKNNLKVSFIRRYWSIQDNEMCGPWWEMELIL